MIVNEQSAIPKLKFAKTNRLIVRSEFQTVFNKGKRLNSYAICLYYYANKLQTARLGVVIAKRVIPKAVNRNTYRRLIKESFRLAQDDIKGLDIVILLKKTPDKQDPSNKKIKHELQKIWQRLPAFPKEA